MTDRKDQKPKVPKLRFPGFEGEWEEKRLGDISLKIGDGIHSTPVYDLKGEYFFVNGNNLTNSNIRISSDTKRVNFQEFNRHNRNLDENTILISINGTIGNVSLYRNEPIILGKSACYIKLKDKNNRLFVFNLLKTNKLQTHFNSELTGSTIKNLSLKSISNTHIFLPSTIEQQKIAAFLESVDKWIENLRSQKQALETYKKGMMQKIFSQEIRFKDDEGKDFPEWEEKRLGDIAFITTGSSNREDSTKEGKYTFFDRSEDIRASSRYLFDGEAIIVAGEGQEFRPKYFVGKFDLHQRTYAIMNFENSVGKFLYHYIEHTRYYFNKMAVGTTVPSLRLPIFTHMPVLLPSKLEQEKIAAYFSNVDNLVYTTQEHLAQVNLWKQALLKILFI